MNGNVDSKVKGSGVGGALAIILVWVLEIFGQQPPGYVIAAFTTILGVGAGWLTPPKAIATPVVPSE